MGLKKILEFLFLVLFSVPLIAIPGRQILEATRSMRPYIKPSTKIVAGTLVVIPMVIKLALNIGTAIKTTIDDLKRSEEPCFGGLPVRLCCTLHERSDRIYWNSGHQSPYWNGTGPIKLKPLILDWAGTFNHLHPERLVYSAAIWAGKCLIAEGARELKLVVY